MKRFVLIGCVCLLIFPLLLTACWPFDRGGGGGGGGSGCHYAYDNITDQGQMLVITDSEENGNSTGHDETWVLSATRSTTVSVSAEAGIDADLSAIVQGVKAHLNVTVSSSVTASIGNMTTITIPTGATGYGDYGVFVQVASGHLYSADCGHDYGAHVTSHIPIRAGWCTWVTGQSPAACESTPPTAPTSQPASFSVTGIDAMVEPTTFDCSQSVNTFNFSATLTISPGSSGGNITYTWIESDGGTNPSITISIPAGQTTATVTTGWMLGAGAPGGTYWKQVVVSSPNSISSNQATFTKASCIS